MSRRLVILLSIAGAVALWALLAGRQSPASGVVEASGRGARPGVELAAASASAASAASPRFTPPRREPLSSDGQAQAFGARQWVAPPPPPPPVVAPPPAPVVVEPPRPPALPYTFVGLLEARAGEKPSVFLSLGDKLIVATVGDNLEAGYRLEAVTNTEVVFFNPQWNYTTRLSIEGGRS